MPTLRTHWPTLGLFAVPFVISPLARPLDAQQERREERIEVRRPGQDGNVMIVRGAASPRRLLGLVLRASGEAGDTAGLLVERVADSSAAALAGVRPGERLVSVEGTTLALDRADVGDRAAGALAERRLQRALEGKKAGDQLSMVVAGENGRRRTVRATLREQPAMRPAWTNLGGTRVPRRVLGLSFAEGGHARDTAGLLVVGVTKGGAADRAGIAPGDRLVRIDEVDLRVDAADAGDAAAANQRVSRLRRALDAAKDSQPVRLEVLQDGRRRTVTATPTTELSWTWGAAASAPGVYRFEEGMEPAGFAMTLPDDALRAAQAGLEAARARLDAELPRLRERLQIEFDGPDGAPAARAVRIAAPRAPMAPGARRGAVRVMVDDADDPAGRRYLRLDRGDIDLATVTGALAERLGRGTEGGLLVLRVTDDWAPLKAGDVIIKVDGRAVSERGFEPELRREAAHTVEVVRNGRTETLALPAR